MLRRQLTGGGVAPVEEEASSAIAKAGVEGHAGAVLRQDPDLRTIDTIGMEAAQQAIAEVVVADRADVTGGQAKTGHLADVDDGIAAGKGALEGAGLVERRVKLRAHDLDQHVAHGEYARRGHLQSAS